MKLGMSTACAGTHDLAKALDVAAKSGLDAIEISAEHLPGLAGGDAGVAVESLRQKAESAKVKICAIHSSLVCGFGNEAAGTTTELRKVIDLAGQLGCPVVILSAPRVPRGIHPAGAGAQVGQWLMAQADYAAEHKVSLAIRNANSFSRVSELWSILESAQHPAVGCCWDMVMSRMMGESPWQAVPVMNLRILDVLLSDARSEAEGGWIATALGEGEVGLKVAIERLRGIGYKGLLTIVPPCVGAGDMQAILTAIVQRLRGWIDPPKPAPAKPAAAKAAAKPAGAAASSAAKPAVAKPAAQAEAKESSTATATADPESK